MRVILSITFISFSLLSLAQDSLLFKQARAFYFNNEPSKALEALDSNPQLKEGIHAVTYYMNAATALSAMNEYEKSNEYFDKAYKIVEDSSKRVGEKALAYLMNPTTTT